MTLNPLSGVFIREDRFHVSFNTYLRLSLHITFTNIKIQSNKENRKYYITSIQKLLSLKLIYLLSQCIIYPLLFLFRTWRIKQPVFASDIYIPVFFSIPFSTSLLSCLYIGLGYEIRIYKTYGLLCLWFAHQRQKCLITLSSPYSCIIF